MTPAHNRLTVFWSRISHIYPSSPDRLQLQRSHHDVCFHWRPSKEVRPTYKDCVSLLTRVVHFYLCIFVRLPRKPQCLIRWFTRKVIVEYKIINKKTKPEGENCEQFMNYKTWFTLYPCVQIFNLTAFISKQGLSLMVRSWYRQTAEGNCSVVKIKSQGRKKGTSSWGQNFLFFFTQNSPG